MEESKETKPLIAPLKIQKNKKKTNWKAIGSIIAIIIMVGSGFILITSNNSEEKLPTNAFKVGTYTFYDTTDGDFGTYLLSQNGTQIPILFRADPRNVSSIFMENITPDLIRTAQKVYIAYNPNQQNLSKVVVAAAQVARIIPLTNGYVPILAYTEDIKPVDETIPIKTCADAGNSTVLILFEVTGTTSITTVGDCVHVSGKDADKLIIAADKLGMNIVGINL